MPVIRHNACGNILVHVLYWTRVLISAGQTPRSRIAGSQGTHVFSLSRYVSLPKHLYQFALPPAGFENSILANTSYFLPFSFLDFGGCGLLSPFSFNLHFLTTKDIQYSFMFISHLAIFFYEVSMQMSCSFFYWVACLFSYCLVGVLYLLDLSCLCDI